MKNILTLLLVAFSFNAMASNVDLAKSSFEWHAAKVTGKHHGMIKLKSGTVKMDKAMISGGELVMDMNTMDVTDLEGEWKDKFLNHMKSEDFFNIPKYPTATLKIKKDDGKQITGDLTIMGKTNEIVIPYKKSGNNYEGTMKFDRTKWDIKYGSGKFFKGLGDKMIYDEASIIFKLVLK